MNIVVFAVYAEGTAKETAIESKHVCLEHVPKGSVLYAAMNFPGRNTDKETYVYIITNAELVEPCVQVINELGTSYLDRKYIPEAAYDYLCVQRPPKLCTLLWHFRCARLIKNASTRRDYAKLGSNVLECINDFNLGFSINTNIKNLNKRVMCVHQDTQSNIVPMYAYAKDGQQRFDLIIRASWSHPDYEVSDIKCDLVHCSNKSVILPDWDGHFDQPYPSIAVNYMELLLKFTHKRTGEPVNGVYTCIRGLQLKTFIFNGRTHELALVLTPTHLQLNLAKSHMIWSPKKGINLHIKGGMYGIRTIGTSSLPRVTEILRNELIGGN